MSRIRKRLPSPAMIVAVVAMVLALAGGAYAAATIGLGDLTNKAKNKTVGVGKLTYVGTSTEGTGNAIRVTAKCPKGLHLIGGGVHTSDPARSEVEESHPDSQDEWQAVVRASGTETIEAIAICAKSRVVRTVGTPLPPPEAP
jgi:hypothetical protein